jgi:hypothetical protein
MYAPVKSTLPQSLGELENLTSEVIKLYDPETDTIYEIEPSGRKCKMSMRIDRVGAIDGVEVIRRVPAGIKGLPSPWDEPNSFFLVPGTVVASNPTDRRLLTINRLRKRNLDGEIVYTQLVGN